MRRLPILSTITVLIAVGVMIALGFWQLDRRHEKDALIAHYEAALKMPQIASWPTPQEYDDVLYRQAIVNCIKVRGIDSIAGRSGAGQSGWVHVARCQHDGSGVADVTIGWSIAPTPPDWAGGRAQGIIVPYHNVIRLVADRPQAGLEPLAKPDPKNLPDNHLAYAGQWFFFAATALLIYFLALRRYWRTSASQD